MGYFANVRKSEIMTSDKSNLCLFLDATNENTEELEVGEHWHYWIEVKYMISGSMKIETAQGVTEVQSGQAVLIGSRIPHKLTFSKGFVRNQNLYINIGLMIENFSSRLLTNVLFIIQDLDQILLYLSEIIQTIQYEDEIQKLRYKGNLMLLLSALAKQERQEGLLSNDNQTDIVSQLVHYVTHHYQKKITLNEIAVLYQYSPQYLSSLFKKQMHVSFYEFLTSMRLGRAKFLLASTNQKVIDIALDCGFTSDNSFILTFHKKMGMTPQAYRKAQKGQMITL